MTDKHNSKQVNKQNHTCSRENPFKQPPQKRIRVQRPRIDFDNSFELEVQNNNKNNNRDSFLSTYLKFNDFLRFSHIVVNYIKKKIGISHNNFSNYLIEKNSKENDEILNLVFSDIVLNNLLKEADIDPNVSKNLIQGKRCLEVISLALLKCSDFECLKDFFESHLNLKRSAIYNVVKKYVPFLSEINPQVNISPWLPSQYTKNYEDFERLGTEKGYPLLTNLKEFKSILDNRGDTYPTDIKEIKWLCETHGHFYQSYTDLQRSPFGCLECNTYTINFEDCVILGIEKGYPFKTTYHQFKILMGNRGHTWPSEIKFEWFCKIHNIFKRTYRRLADTINSCPKCAKYKITFEDCIQLGLEKGSSFVTSQEKFNEIMNNRSKTKPALVDTLEWFCKIHNKIFRRSYDSFRKIDMVCPWCLDRYITVGNLHHPIAEYYSLVYFNYKGCQCIHEHLINIDSKHKPDLIIERDSDLINNIETFQNIVQFSEKITQILLDFTFSKNEKLILNKCKKLYQKEDRYLLIILMSYDSKDLAEKMQYIMEKSQTISFNKNIKILTFEQYLVFLNLTYNRLLSKFEKNSLVNFKNSRNLTIDSYKNDKYFEELYILSKNCSDLLEKIKISSAYNPKRVKYSSSIETKDIYFSNFCDNNQNGLSCKGKRK